MLFNSAVFVFAFLPLVFLGYYGLRYLKLHVPAKLYLLAASLFFYGYFSPRYLLILIGSIVINYLVYLVLMRLPVSEGGQGIRRGVMLVAVTLNLASIVYFKYYDFFIENINAVTKASLPLLHVALPLGISFFTFQQISFVIDTYRGRTGRYSWLDYSVFVSFFPQLVAGPIVMHNELIPQLSEEKRFRIRPDYITVGIRYFVIGLAKKVLLADRLSLVVTYGYDNLSALNTPEAVWLILAYTLQIYFDFSGYSDMAIGLGKMLGFDLPKNFDEPYKAKNIQVFWDRWHMTMTRFFTQYLYFPLGGSRKGKVRTCINVMVVFAMSGLWHGAGWTFVIWGCLHGVASVFHRIFHRRIDKLPIWLTTLVTFGFVNFAWVFFRAGDLMTALHVFSKLLRGGFGNLALTAEGFPMVNAFCGSNITDLMTHFGVGAVWQQVILLALTIIVMIGMLLLVFVAPGSHRVCGREKTGRFEGLWLAVLMVLCVMTFSSVSEFLYFQF